MVARNKEQIHIVGSKQDIENFANFVENDASFCKEKLTKVFEYFRDLWIL